MKVITLNKGKHKYINILKEDTSNSASMVDHCHFRFPVWSQLFCNIKSECHCDVPMTQRKRNGFARM